MDYVVQTGRGLAGAPPSREEAASFWSELTGVEVPRVLVLMADAERAQEDDPRAYGARKVYTLAAPSGEPYPQMLWGEGAAEGSGLTFTDHERLREGRR